MSQDALDKDLNNPDKPTFASVDKDEIFDDGFDPGLGMSRKQHKRLHEILPDPFFHKTEAEFKEDKEVWRILNEFMEREALE